jgi:hypothetical protein
MKKDVREFQGAGVQEEGDKTRESKREFSLRPKRRVLFCGVLLEKRIQDPTCRTGPSWLRGKHRGHPPKESKMENGLENKGWKCGK